MDKSPVACSSAHVGQTTTCAFSATWPRNLRLCKAKRSCRTCRETTQAKGARDIHPIILQTACRVPRSEQEARIHTAGASEKINTTIVRLARPESLSMQHFVFLVCLFHTSASSTFGRRGSRGTLGCFHFHFFSVCRTETAQW